MTIESKKKALPIPSRLTFVGGGNLAQALLCGIYAKSAWKDDCNITVTARRPEHARELQKKFPAAFVTLDNLDPAIWQPAQEDRDGSHTLIICTRPADVPGVTARLAPMLEAMDIDVRPTIVTMCPGICVEQLQSWLPNGTPIVRSMPNTPVACCQGATALYPSQEALSRVDQVVTVLQDISPAVCVLPEEFLLDVVAAISG
jgi:pyrroline-5-carboxylate reductase